MTEQRPSTAFHLTLNGEDLGRFDPMTMPNSEIYLLENEFGITWAKFCEGIGEMRAAAVDALIFLMYHRKGHPITKGQIVWTPQQIADGMTGEPVPPTGPSSEPAETATSDSSPTSAI